MTRRLALACVWLAFLACTNSGTTTPVANGSPTTSQAPETPSPTRSPRTESHQQRRKSHHYVSVVEVQAIDASTTVATFQMCTAKRDENHCSWHLATTSDLGRTWNDITPPNVPFGDPLTNPAFLDADHGWLTLDDCVGGFARLYRTSDGGATWRHVPVDPTVCAAGSGIQQIPVTDSEVYAATSEPTGDGGHLSLSTDGGATFTERGEYPDGPPVPAPSFVSVDEGWGSEPAASGLMHTVDRGSTWDKVAIPPVGCCRGDSYSAQPPSWEGAIGVAPVVAHHAGRWHVQFDMSADLGRSWKPRPGLTVGGRYQPAIGIADPWTWWVAPDGGTTLRLTSDAGATWHQRAALTGQIVDSIEPIGAGAAWILTRGTGEHEWLYRTVDDGRSWQRMHPDMPSFRTVAMLDGDAQDVVGGANGAVYAAVVTHNGEIAVERWVPGSSSVVRSTSFHANPIQGGNLLAVSNGSVWVAANGPYAKHPSRTLLRLDADTLALQARVTMPAPPGAVVATPNGLWVGAGRHLLLLDTSGREVNDLTIPGTITHMTVDPSDTRLYVSTNTKGSGRDDVVFQERSARTGDLLVDGHGIGLADLGGPSGLAATDEGVWVSQPTGMMGGLQLMQAADLRATHPVARDDTGSNAIRGSVADGRLWISDFSGLRCADATTGQILQRIGDENTTSGISNVVSTAAGLFAADGNRLVELSPALHCLS